MIRSIVIVLDADSDSPVATQYALTLASRTQALVTGMTVVDTKSIEHGVRGGGIGSIHLMEKAAQSLLSEAHEVARTLLTSFKAAAKTAGVAYECRALEGWPLDVVGKEADYHDLLVIGNDPHLYYAHPKETPVSLEQVIKRTTGAVLVATDSYQPVERVLVAFDGSAHCFRSLRAFLLLKPFGTDVAMDLVHVHAGEDQGVAGPMMSAAQAFVARHGFTARVHLVQGKDASSEIGRCIQRLEADLLVAGVHAVGSLERIFQRSTTASLLGRVAVPMWVAG